MADQDVWILEPVAHTLGHNCAVLLLECLSITSRSVSSRNSVWENGPGLTFGLNPQGLLSALSNFSQYVSSTQSIQSCNIKRPTLSNLIVYWFVSIIPIHLVIWNLNKSLDQHKNLVVLDPQLPQVHSTGKCPGLFEFTEKLSLEERFPLLSTHVSKSNMFISNVLLGSWSRISCPPPPNSDRKFKTV